jgi:MFS family permease
MPTLLARARAIQQEYPNQFWVLFFGALISSLGSGLVFPFLSLYLTIQLKFSMTEVGVTYAIFAVMSVISQVVGGTLTDHWGRKPVMMVSLWGTVAGTLLFASAALLDLNVTWLRWSWVAIVILVMGLTSGAFGPAVNAMIADMIEVEKRAGAYGLLRMMQSLGISIGPAIGGFIAQISYSALFLIAAAAAFIYSLIMAVFIKETRPQLPQISQEVSPVKTANPGFRHILMDWVFLAFCGLMVISQIVYAQMNTTLPVYLHGSFGVTEQWYGLMMSLNAVMVVLLQFPITHSTSRIDKSVIMAVGNCVFAVGFGMFGFVSVLPLFFLAQGIWTVGEMLTVPVSQTMASDFSPETMRGRYMGAYGVVFAIAYGFGPLLGGIIMDSIGGKYIWYAAILLDVLVALGFLILRGVFKQRETLPRARIETIEVSSS